MLFDDVPTTPVDGGAATDDGALAGAVDAGEEKTDEGGEEGNGETA